jgi:Flp pilus assembly protein TadG
MLKDKKGNAAAEFGLLFPILLVAILGVVDLGWDAVEAQSASAAAQAGADYAIVNGFDVAGITSAVTSSSSLGGITASPAPTNTKTGCASGTGIGSCAGQPAGTYVVVSAKASFAPILSWVGTPPSFASATIVRIN